MASTDYKIPVELFVVQVPKRGFVRTWMISRGKKFKRSNKQGKGHEGAIHISQMIAACYSKVFVSLHIQSVNILSPSLFSLSLSLASSVESFVFRFSHFGHFSLEDSPVLRILKYLTRRSSASSRPEVSSSGHAIFPPVTRSLLPKSSRWMCHDAMRLKLVCGVYQMPV